MYNAIGAPHAQSSSASACGTWSSVWADWRTPWGRCSRCLKARRADCEAGARPLPDCQFACVLGAEQARSRLQFKKTLTLDWIHPFPCKFGWRIGNIRRAVQPGTQPQPRPRPRPRPQPRPLATILISDRPCHIHNVELRCQFFLQKSFPIASQFQHLFRK